MKTSGKTGKIFLALVDFGIKVDGTRSNDPDRDGLPVKSAAATRSQHAAYHPSGNRTGADERRL